MDSILISIGNWEYAHEPQLDIPAVSDSLNKVTQYFTDNLHYRLERRIENPTSNDLLTDLDEWFASPDRKETDWVVVYYSGHGKLEAGGELYLLTSNYKNDRTPSTAFRAGQLWSMLVSQNASGQARRTERVLVILDTCFSGAAAVSFASEVKARFSQGTSGPMFYVIAAALPLEEAIGGRLVDAFISAMENPALGGAHQEFIFFDQLAPAMNQKMKPYQLTRVMVDSPNDIPRFFPNPRWKPQAHFGATVREIRSAVEKNEYESHWNPVSRGVEFASQTGDFFTGRKQILDSLTQWLSAPGGSGMHVVTGAPGSGKSAIVSRILATSMTDGPAVDLAIHLRGKTLAEVVARMAEHFETAPEAAAVLAGLRNRQQPFRLVLDALDEAREPALIAADLLRPLQAVPRAKVLVGSRKEWIPALGDQTVSLNIDSPEYSHISDIAAFVEARLAGIPGDHKALAQNIARKAYPNFLIARLVAEDLCSRPELPASDSIDFPESVDQAFDQFLSRFGEDQQRARDLLQPLAWSEGAGLPWDTIWVLVANAMAGVNRYQNSDIEWLLDHAGSFVVETLENSRSAYRLYHQALADHFRRADRSREIQGAIVSALLASVPVEEDRRDWFSAHPYLRMHLAEHAAAAGVLPELMSDAAFLIFADSTNLLSAINSSISPVPSDLLRAYKSASLAIRTLPPAEAASYLALAIRQASAQMQPFYLPASPWQVSWGHWAQRAVHARIASGDSPVSALELGVWTGNRPVALVGRENGDVEVWEIATNGLLSQWEGESQSVKFVALASGDSHPFVVAVRAQTLLCVNDALSEQTRSVETTTGDRDRITDMLVTQHHGKWVCVTAHYNSRIVIWNLPDLSVQRELRDATGASIFCLCVVKSAGRMALLSGGDHLAIHSETSVDSTLHLWSLDDLSLLWKDGRGLTSGYPTEVCAATIGDRSMALVTGLLTAAIWDMDELRSVYSTSRTAGSWHLYHSREKDLLLESNFGTLRVFDLNAEGDPMYITLPPNSESFDLAGSYMTSVGRSQGRDIVLDARSEHVRVWVLDDLLHDSERPQQSVIRYGQLAMIPDVAICGSAESLSINDVVFFDPLRGKVRQRLPVPAIGVADGVKSIASGGASQLFAANRNGTIFKLEWEGQSKLSRLFTADQRLEQLRVTHWRGKTLGFTTGCDEKRRYSVRIWDLETGEELFTNRSFALQYGEQDKALLALAVSEIEDDVRFAFAGQYGKIMVANLVAKPAGLYPADFDVWQLPFPTSGTTYTRCLAVWGPLLAAGTEKGELAILDFSSGECLATKRDAHRGYIHSLVMRWLDGRVVLLSAGSDGSVAFWSGELEPLGRIEVGEAVFSAIWISDAAIAIGTDRGLLAIELSPVFLAGRAVK
jgi:WD40 repeat protein